MDELRLVYNGATIYSATSVEKGNYIKLMNLIADLIDHELGREPRFRIIKQYLEQIKDKNVSN